MNIRKLFTTIGSNYLPAKGEEFAGHELAALVRKEPTLVFKNLIIDEDLLVESSAGKGGWADVPWIAFINKLESDGVQEGMYVVYLFSEDMKRLYLCLGHGVDRPIKKFGKKDALSKMLAQTQHVRTAYKVDGFKYDDLLSVAASGRGSSYQKATIFYKEYDLSNLPEDKDLESDLNFLLKKYNHILYEENILTEGTDFTDSVGSVEEGKRILKSHYIRERNPKIIREAKNKVLKEGGELKCEICSFKFFDHYGERGKNYIEGHHKLPVSEMEANSVTKVDDIALVCSNCHRMVHTKQPWLSIEELKNIYEI